MNESVARATAAGRLPGDPTARALVHGMIRVDQAGERGAVRIYEGQLAVLGRSATAGIIRHMAAQEQAHRQTFDRLAADRRVRPTLLSPLWHVAGYALGAATALMGEHAAMACTVAVEEVIDAHYGEQLALLGDDEAALRQTIAECRADELAHRDTALAHGASDAPAHALLTEAVKGASRLAIWLSTRL
ncbi:MAG: demethoxyubiquinone hydroxylase family protein [Alphaproteobacteria bacterium]|nr:demethoxyubiquinone hydroxylase family protein [Alphaproteobacteria bacterium]